ncbi:MAG: hypothetical protein ABL908_05875 [Hyphomicrobium sp.]
MPSINLAVARWRSLFRHDLRRWQPHWRERRKPHPNLRCRYTDSVRARQLRGLDIQYSITAPGLAAPSEIAFKNSISQRIMSQFEPRRRDSSKSSRVADARCHRAAFTGPPPGAAPPMAQTLRNRWPFHRFGVCAKEFLDDVPDCRRRVRLQGGVGRATAGPAAEHRRAVMNVMVIVNARKVSEACEMPSQAARRQRRRDYW